MSTTPHNVNIELLRPIVEAILSTPNAKAEEEMQAIWSLQERSKKAFEEGTKQASLYNDLVKARRLKNISARPDLVNMESILEKAFIEAYKTDQVEAFINASTLHLYPEIIQSIANRHQAKNASNNAFEESKRLKKEVQTGIQAVVTRLSTEALASIKAEILKVAPTLTDETIEQAISQIKKSIMREKFALLYEASARHIKGIVRISASDPNPQQIKKEIDSRSRTFVDQLRKAELPVRAPGLSDTTVEKVLAATLEATVEQFLIKVDSIEAAVRMLSEVAEAEIDRLKAQVEVPAQVAPSVRDTSSSTRAPQDTVVVHLLPETVAQTDASAPATEADAPAEVAPTEVAPALIFTGQRPSSALHARNTRVATAQSSSICSIS